MPPRGLRLIIIFCIVYGSLFVGAIEHIPIIKPIHQIGMTLVLAAWLVDLWRKDRPFPATPLDRLLLAMGIAWMLSAALSRDPRVSLEYTWPIWFHILLFYLLVDLMRRHTLWRRWIVEGLFITAAIIVMLSALEITAWYFGLSILPQFSFTQSWPSLAGLSLPPVLHNTALALNHKNLLGAYCVLVIPVTAAWGQVARRRDERWALWGLTGGVMLTLILTQSRGAYMGLATIFGLWLLRWLLCGDVRGRLPAPLRPLLDPRLLIGGMVLMAFLAAGLVFWVTIHADHSSLDDISRLDLWYSATRMLRDHPVLGVGPREFGFERLWYPNWEFSPSYMVLRHAHNTILNVLAEGGIVLFTLMVAVIVRFVRVWWSARRTADAGARQRLDGIAIAFLAFAAHNTVDAFPRRTQVAIPMLIIAAYVIANYTITTPKKATQPDWKRRLPVGVALGLVILFQLAFIPIHRSGLLYAQSVGLLHTDQPDAALEKIRAAQETDPWFSMYRLEEANILGYLANENPDEYLLEAIAAFEDSLDRNVAWDTGWYNLSTLYAQAGRYEDAIRAVQKALERDQWPAEYHLKLGEYYTALGRDEAARTEYFEALRRKPLLASIDSWHNPNAPEWTTIVGEAVDHFAVDDPQTALDLAVYAGDLDAALTIANSVDLDHASASLRRRINVLWPVDREHPCTICYILDSLYGAQPPEARDDLIRAELIWPTDPANAEKAARKALFISESETVWGWYVLARIGEQNGEDSDQINLWLLQAVHPPTDYHRDFAQTAYGIAGDLGKDPQARVITQPPVLYAPWLDLAARYESEGEWDNARYLYEWILDREPYAWDVQALLEELPPKSETDD